MQEGLSLGDNKYNASYNIPWGKRQLFETPQDLSLSVLLENIEIELLSPVLELPDLLDEAGVLEGGLEADNVLLVVSRGHQLASSRRHLVIVRFTRVVYSPFLLQKLFKSV